MGVLKATKVADAVEAEANGLYGIQPHYTMSCMAKVLVIRISSARRL